MFAHIFVNRFKCVVRDRQALFWTFAFPLLLATLFGMAFSNLNKGEAFYQIPIAIVDDAQYQGDAYFQQAIAAVSDQSAAEEDQLFVVSLVSSGQEAEDALSKGEISGYIQYEGGVPGVVVNNSGFYQSILVEFTNHYLQTRSAYEALMQSNPAAIQALMADAGERTAYTRDVSPTSAAPNDTLTYFYALIAMACMYGGFWGLKEVSTVQANQSYEGARLNLAPVHKLKVFGYSLMAAITVQYAAILLLIAYLGLVLKVDFGTQLGYVLLAGFAGSAMGVCFGALIGAAVKGGEKIKMAFMLGLSMLFSFFSGLMIADMKYTVTKAVPILSYLNPANLVADAYYALYYYSDHTRYFTNIALLFGFSAAFILIVYLVMRRQRYASL